jgi:hypothetical protein
MKKDTFSEKIDDDDYRVCSGEEKAVAFWDGESSEQAIDGTAVPVVIWGGVAVRQAVDPTALA